MSITPLPTPRMDAWSIWNQWDIPVILRRRERLRMRLPYRADNREWLRGARRLWPEWLPRYRCWEMPRAWFDDLVDASLIGFGEVYVIQPHREMEKCAPSCQQARGHDCECSCMGANHGQGSDGTWFEVSETFAFRWGAQQLACRLIRSKYGLKRMGL